MQKDNSPARQPTVVPDPGAGEKSAARLAHRILPVLFFPGVRRRSWAGAFCALFACGCALGWWLLSLSQSATYQLQQGMPVSHLTELLATGSTWATAWEGWAAALLFAATAIYIARARPEPSPSLKRQDSAGAMRSAMRREFKAARTASWIILALALLDTGRTAVFCIASIAGNSIAISDLLPLGVEAAGWDAAAIAIILMAAVMRSTFSRMGAFAGKSAVDQS